MKPHKQSLIIIFCVLTAIAIFFIHPSKLVYEAAISGIVLDKNSRPIPGALVTRVSQKPAGKSGEKAQIQRTKLSSAVTDSQGQYRFQELSRTQWFHSPMELLFPWVHCYAFIEVTATGYNDYKSVFGDKDLSSNVRDKRACNGVKFIKNVELSPNYAIKVMAE